MAAQTTNELARVRYWQGQLLASGDLQAQLLADDELRRLHNRAVHGAYGVAVGLTPTLDGQTFKLGCGMAYDCAGRGLVVAEERTLPLPGQAPAVLVLSYDPAGPDGVSLKWRPPREVNPNAEIAVARLSAVTPDPLLDPDFSPVVARPLARPRIANGNTIPGETPWEPWKIGETESGVQVVIDTSAAGFTRTPHYFAEAVAGNPEEGFVPAWFASIADPSPQGFTFRLMLRRITRESLDIADPKARLVEPPPPGGQPLRLAAEGIVAFDQVARLLPLAESASVVKTLSGSTVTLETALGDFTGTKEVAFGNGPRLAGVTKTSTKNSIVSVTVDQPAAFQEGNVIVNLSAQPESTRPAQVASIDDAGALELLTPIAGLAINDTLGIAQQATAVKSFNGREVKVEDPAQFAVGDLAVRLGDAVETSAPVKVTEKKTDGTLVFSQPLTGLQTGSLLGVVRAAAKVVSIEDNTGVIDIEVDNPKPFRKGDIVAKIFIGGRPSVPVRVQHVTTSRKRLTLSGAIPGLAVGDIIGAADFHVRATVLGVSGPQNTTVTVTAASLFPVQQTAPTYVARIDDLLRASLPAAVNASAGQTLTLGGAIEDLKQEDVIGLCSFPVAVRVQDVQENGRLVVVSPNNLLRESDVLTALPTRAGLALVAQVGTNTVRLAGAIENLSVGDTLAVANVRGVVSATATASQVKVTVDQPERLRVGDFLADIVGWRQATPLNLPAPLVTAANGSEITLSTRLDGLLLNDAVGLASLNTSSFFFFITLRLRLKHLPDIRPGDEALVVALDRLRSETRSMFATVIQVTAARNEVVLMPQEPAGEFTFRPEDIFASVLFVRGSALALIRKQDLFVSWLAVGVPDPMPRPCAGADVTDDPCSEA